MNNINRQEPRTPPSLKLRRAGKNQGFTLVEMTVAIFCFTLIAVGMIGLISAMLTINRQQSGLLSDQDQARKVAFSIMSELRNCQSSSFGAYAIATSTAQELAFYSNIDNDQAIELIDYYTQNGHLYKSVTKPSGGGYPAAARVTNLVENNVANGANPLFYYYDGNYTGTQAALSQPVDPASIRFVSIQLQIFNKAGVNGSNSYTVTASAAIRKLKTNLAQ